MTIVHRWCEALAPAKVNPWLHVGARRADGYHEVDLGMLALELGDRVRARLSAVRRTSSAGRVELAVGGPAASADVPRDGSNLAARAALAVLGQAEPGASLELVLYKEVPSQAGLGGGSSDAAAAALAAWAALGEPCPRGRLVELVAALSSDAAFFLAAADSGFARCTGRGELVAPLDSDGAERWTLAVIAPAVPSSTAAVYARFRNSLSRPARIHRVLPAFFDGTEPEVRGALANDLEHAAQAAVPELARWRALLDAMGAGHWRLCGSGSAFFGIYAEADEARGDLLRAEERAGAAGLALRARWLTRPARRGARLLPT